MEVDRAQPGRVLTVSSRSTGGREIKAKTENRASEANSLRWQEFHNVL
jgi:hypothetical protein